MLLGDANPDGTFRQQLIAALQDPEVVNILHQYSDYDTVPDGLHHQLGLRHDQSSYGDHGHDSKNSALLLDPTFLSDITGGGVTLKNTGTAQAPTYSVTDIVTGKTFSIGVASSSGQISANAAAGDVGVQIPSGQKLVVGISGSADSQLAIRGNDKTERSYTPWGSTSFSWPSTSAPTTWGRVKIADNWVTASGNVQIASNPGFFSSNLSTGMPHSILGLPSLNDVGSHVGTWFLVRGGSLLSSGYLYGRTNWADCYVWNGGIFTFLPAVNDRLSCNWNYSLAI